MDSKVAKLTETLLKEGVERGEQERQKIVAQAQERATQLLRQAEEQAAEIIDQAKKAGQELKRNMEAETVLASTQALEVLKQKIVNLISQKVLSEKITNALTGEQFLGEVIKASFASFHSQSGQIQVVLPENIASKVEGYLRPAIATELQKAPTFLVDKSLHVGFQIILKDQGLKISFTDHDFTNFLEDFFRPKIRTLLFGE